MAITVPSLTEREAILKVQPMMTWQIVVMTWQMMTWQDCDVDGGGCEGREGCG